jgi:hypothetical protein
MNFILGLMISLLILILVGTILGAFYVGLCQIAGVEAEKTKLFLKLRAFLKKHLKE